MGLKPMNCPGHTQIYNEHAPLLPRPADPLLRAGAAAPQRGLRRAARAAARAPLRPGRRAHLLHRGAGPGGGRGCLASASPCMSCSASTCARALHPARAAHRHRRDVGPRRGHADARAGELGLEYELNPGDGAFYGPKIDMHMTDSLGRSWQLGTVQLDYSMPERFDLTYTGADNARASPRDDPPRAVRLLRALHRHHARALRRRTPALAGARAGDRAARLRPLQRLRLRGSSAARAPTTRASSSTIAASRSGARSARPSCARSPTCSSSASGSRG